MTNDEEDAIITLAVEILGRRMRVAGEVFSAPDSVKRF